MLNIYVLQQLSELYELSVDSILQEREEYKMNKKVNYFALFGSLIFNLFLFSGIALILLILLATLWFLAILIVCLPFIIAYANLSRGRNFELIQTGIILICFVAGVVLISLSQKTKPVMLVNFNSLKNISNYLLNVAVLALKEYCTRIIYSQIYSRVLELNVN